MDSSIHYSRVIKAGKRRKYWGTPYSWSSLDYIYTEDTITRLSVWYAGEPVFNLFKTGRGGLHCYGIKYHLIQHTKETWQ